MVVTLPTGREFEIPGQSDLNPTLFQPFFEEAAAKGDAPAANLGEGGVGAGGDGRASD